MSVSLSFFLTPFPLTNLRAKYIYGFLLIGRRYSSQPILKLIGESLFRKTHFSYSEKCPSEYTAICPSEQIPQKVSFGTCIGSYSELKHNCSSHLRTSSETYPYPKGEHNGAVGPKYASLRKSDKIRRHFLLIGNKVHMLI